VIGNVYMARGLVFRWRPSIGHKPNEPTPATLNYDLWTGPAEMQPFSRRIVHYNWHWNWNYGNGDVGNQGIHETVIGEAKGRRARRAAITSPTG